MNFRSIQMKIIILFWLNFFTKVSSRLPCLCLNQHLRFSLFFLFYSLYISKCILMILIPKCIIIINLFFNLRKFKLIIIFKIELILKFHFLFIQNIFMFFIFFLLFLFFFFYLFYLFFYSY